MKFSQENLTAICNSLATTPSFRLAAARAGISEATLFSWASQSRKGTRPELVLNEWMGERAVPFHIAMGTARKVSLHAVVSAMEHRGLVGHQEPVFFQGRPQWREDEGLASLDDETVALLGYPDRYERDANGNRIQLTLHIQPPVALVLAIAGANFPAIYGDKRTVNITQKSSVGVTIAKTDYAKPLAAPPAAALTDQRVVEEVVDEAIFEAINEDVAEDQDDLDDVAEDVAPAPAPRPPTPAQPTGSGPNPAVKRGGLTPMEQDLMQRLAAKPGSAARSTPISQSLHDTDDYAEDHVGAGPAPSGTKIA